MFDDVVEWFRICDTDSREQVKTKVNKLFDRVKELELRVLNTPLSKNESKETVFVFVWNDAKDIIPDTDNCKLVQCKGSFMPIIARYWHEKNKWVEAECGKTIYDVWRWADLSYLLTLEGLPLIRGKVVISYLK